MDYLKKLHESKVDTSNLFEYFETEACDLQDEICISLRWNYRRIYNAEADAYRRSPEYKKAKSKAYWSRPKEERDQEALDDVLAKLDYWVPHRGTNDHHISYSKKVDRDSSLGQYEPFIGFSPSISESEYCIKAVAAAEEKLSDPILLAVLNNIKSAKSLFLIPKKFDKSILLTLPKVDEEYLKAFCEQLAAVYELFGINEFNSFRTQSRNIVTNGCKVKAIILEQNKPTTISVNICKYSGQTSLLGKRVGDKFKLSNIPLTYQIQNISR
jgi:hypothetical protein